jgi:hypothetical protein
MIEDGECAMGRGRRERGQAAVETALILPTHLFAMLGILQMALTYQAKLVAEYAVFKVARSASVYRNDCPHMIDAAIIALGPTLEQSPRTTASDPVDTRLTENIIAALNNKNTNVRANTPLVVVQYYLEDPNSNRDFDEQLAPGEQPLRIHVRLGYFFEYRVPFANVILARFWLAMHTGQRWTDGTNPLMAIDSNPSQPGLESGFDAELLSISQSNINLGVYAPPVVATWTMRMMSEPNRDGNPYHTCR